MSSLPLRKKVSKSLAKLTGALKKTPRRIGNFLGLTPSPSSRKEILPNPPYSSIMSLYECPCNYHLCQREELERRRVNPGGAGNANKGISESPGGGVYDRDTKPESENGSVGDGETPPVEQRMDDGGKECSSPFEVNERAERFIESFREDQKLQRQRTVHDY